MKGPKRTQDSLSSDVAQAINISLPDDLFAQITSSQARDGDSPQGITGYIHPQPILTPR